ncbi:MAG: hypothetical protein NTZ12_06260 [Candidatus Aminicenantes bacterium]|nr:hypothetical protein [Candidatus Aminicenantes bacterium]
MNKMLTVFFVICFLFNGLCAEEKHELIGKKVVIIEIGTDAMVEGILKEFEVNKFFTVIDESGEEITRYWYENIKILTEPSEIAEVKNRIKNSIKVEKDKSEPEPEKQLKESAEPAAIKKEEKTDRFEGIKIHNRSTFTIALGYNTYSPGMETRYKMYPEGFKDLSFGGMIMSFRVLMKTKWLDSRLNLGFEFGWSTLATYESEIFYNLTTKEYTNESDSGWPWQFLAGYLLLGSEKLYAHAVVGFGGVNVSELDSNKYGTEMAASAKILFGIPVGTFLSIDPEIGVLLSLGQSRLTTITFLVGLSLDLGELFKR